MPVNHQKDESHVIAKADFMIGKFPGHYYRGFLWNDLETMREAIATVDDDFANVLAACCHDLYIQVIPASGRVENKCPKRMGELHFARGKWDMNLVCHECFHATTNICRVCNIQPALNIEQEEFAAYVQGELTGAVYAWLWTVDAERGITGKVWKWHKKLCGLKERLGAWKDVAGRLWF